MMITRSAKKRHSDFVNGPIFDNEPLPINVAPVALTDDRSPLGERKEKSKSENDSLD